MIIIICLILILLNIFLEVVFKKFINTETFSGSLFQCLWPIPLAVPIFLLTMVFVSFYDKFKRRNES